MAGLPGLGNGQRSSSVRVLLGLMLVMSVREWVLTSPVALAQAPLVMTGMTVIDVRDGHLLPNLTLIVAGDRIRAIGSSRTQRIPVGGRVLSLPGKYLIPGLWDMHFHVHGYPDVMYPLAVANGVTGVREMNHPDLPALLQWRREIASAARVGPRAFVTGGFLGGPDIGDVSPTLQLGIDGPEQARRTVDSLKAAGVDFIKVRGGLTRAAYFAAVAEARRIEVPLDGHLSDSVTVVEASDSGQRTIEHQLACDDDDGTDEQCAVLAARLRHNRTWITPTAVSLRYLYGGVAPDRLRFWPDSVRTIFDGFGSASGMEKWWVRYAQRTARAIRAGIPLLAGTDAAPAFPENTAGFSLHEELFWFVQNGMTPLAALQTATLNPAICLNGTDSLGDVTTGKLADLVILDADPLKDIHNLEKIYAVVANGRYFDRAQLDSLIADVERRGRGRLRSPVP